MNGKSMLMAVNTRNRHIFFYKFFRPLVALFLRIKFGYSYKLPGELPQTYIVLSNHVTDYDPLFVASSFKKQMYFVASEHIFRWKTAGKLLRFGFAPIARYKGSNAASTVMEVLRAIRSGANVCIFAEGVRSWDGLTNPILPSTGKMVKSARCGLVTYKITGGYFVSPIWSGKNLRHGPISGAPVNVYTKEQLAAMSADEVNELIARDLHEDAYARQLASPARYRGERLAERLEDMFFLCPECGGVGTLRSMGDSVECSCGLKFGYNEFGMLEGAPMKTVLEWANYQKEWLRERAKSGGISFTAPRARLATISRHVETPVDEGELYMDAKVLRVGGTSFELSRLADLAMHGRYIIVFSDGEGYYELTPEGEPNIYKFLQLYLAVKSI